MTIKTTFTCSLIALLSLGSCELFESEEEKAPYYVVKTDESKDINKLGKLINLEKFRPKKVDFQHIYIETVNGNGSEEPKDDYLQAVLYFDAVTFKKMLQVSGNADYPNPNYPRRLFEFPWLNSKLDEELGNSDPSYHGHPDLFFESEGGKIWFLDQKVLLYREIK